jgi:hypothetical protein
MPLVVLVRSHLPGLTFLLSDLSFLVLSTPQFPGAIVVVVVIVVFVVVVDVKRKFIRVPVCCTVFIHDRKIPCNRRVHASVLVVSGTPREMRHFSIVQACWGRRLRPLLVLSGPSHVGPNRLRQGLVGRRLSLVHRHGCIVSRLVLLMLLRLLLSLRLSLSRQW